VSNLAADGSINPAADRVFRRISAELEDGTRQDCGH
jgi:hypothetical protein